MNMHGRDSKIPGIVTKPDSRWRKLYAKSGNQPTQRSCQDYIIFVKCGLFHHFHCQKQLPGLEKRAFPHVIYLWDCIVVPNKESHLDILTGWMNVPPTSRFAKAFAWKMSRV